jgi:hypothetical protein
MNFIELSLIKVRKANIKLIHSEIAIAYWELIYNALGYINSIWRLDSVDIDWKPNASYIYSVSHIDLMMTYLEDFIWGDLMDEWSEYFLENNKIQKDENRK